MILVIDNYDSFTYNLVQYLGELGANLKVFRNDKIHFHFFTLFRLLILNIKKRFKCFFPSFVIQFISKVFK